MTLVMPANAKGPVPVLMMFGRSGLAGPRAAAAEDLDKINAALRALLMKSDPASESIFDAYPAYSPDRTRPAPFGGFGAA